MANEQINVPSLVLVLVLSGLIIRYLFFSSPAGDAGAGTGRGRGGAVGAAAAGGRRGDSSVSRAREAAVERIQQMFPQVDRRTILWDLQRTGGNLTATTERILAGRLETPPISFQPPPPPPNPTSAAATSSPAGSGSASGASEKPAHPDLITRYNLHEKIAASGASDASSDKSSGSDVVESRGKGGKAWSSSREERQALLQKRRDEMILAARRKMEAKIAAEKASGGAAGVSP